MAKSRNPSAGQLYYHFAFLKREELDDGMGNFRGKWVEKFKCHADLTLRQGNEAVMAARLEGKKPAFLLIRRSENASKITTDWACRDILNSTFDEAKGKVSGATYNIRSIEIDTYNRSFYRLTLEGGVAIG